MKRTILPVLTAVLAATLSAQAKVDLVTLPKRDAVQLTIYNSADMTLVRDGRELTLKDGLNKMEFSWANTLIDPTSLEMLAKASAEKIEVFDLTYPPRVQNLGVWNIRSRVSGKVPMEITYLTSGLSWRAFYMGTMSGDEKVMKLEGYVLVTNNSGEDYENAQTRLIVGKVHMLDEIAELARRQYPYGRPGLWPPRVPMPSAVAEQRMAKVALSVAEAAAAEPKQILKEGLSEYFLYTIEGTETIPNGWSKRLPSFDVDGVPVVNLYKYDEERWGNAVVRMLSFKNDKAHKLGQTPIPDGVMKVYRTVDALKHLSYEGQSGFKYIPVDEDVELNLGVVANVIVKPTLMDVKTDNFMFNSHGDVDGWDTIQEYKIEVKNTREVACKVEITRNFPTRYWKLEPSGESGQYEKVDIDTAKFTLMLEPRTKKEFRYVLTIREGRRAE